MAAPYRGVRPDGICRDCGSAPGEQGCPGCVDPIDTPCAACNAEPGEECRPGCIGKAAHDEGDN